MSVTALDEPPWPPGCVPPPQGRPPSALPAAADNQPAPYPGAMGRVRTISHVGQPRRGKLLRCCCEVCESSAVDAFSHIDALNIGAMKAGVR